MFGEGTMSQILGSCDCDIGNSVTKIAAEKIEKVSLIFSAEIFDFHHLISPIAIVGPLNTQYCIFVQHF